MATAGLVPALVDDSIEEILLRFPPDDPAALVRAALVCKGWRRLVSNPRFRRRFREFHRAAPMLGFLCSQRASLHFESTTSFRPRYAGNGSGVQVQRALDARHGRVLLGSTRRDTEDLVVWDPVRGDLQTLPPLRHWCCEGWTAALLCAAAGCDHLDCAPRGPFRVVLVGTDWMSQFVTSVWLYSSEVGAWSEDRKVAIVPPPNTSLPINMGPSALVGNALYFRCATGILEHDLGTHVSEFTRPPAFFMPDHCDALMTAEDRGAMLMTTEDGDLGLAVIQQSKLVLWSRETHLESGKENTRWAQSRVIELGALLPVNTFLYSARLVGIADGIAVILVEIAGRLFTIDLKSSRVKEIGKGPYLDAYRVVHGYHVVPFVSFCTPALEAASSDVGLGATASTASKFKVLPWMRN